MKNWTNIPSPSILFKKGKQRIRRVCWTWFCEKTRMDLKIYACFAREPIILHDNISSFVLLKIKWQELFTSDWEKNGVKRNKKFFFKSLT